VDYSTLKISQVRKGGLPPLVECHSNKRGKPAFLTMRLSNLTLRFLTIHFFNQKNFCRAVRLHAKSVAQSSDPSGGTTTCLSEL
jgi:hypothetical protein